MIEPKLFVGIGASAGGLEAIEKFFCSVPDNTGMAFVVIQHLSPDYKSLMVELLSKKTSLRVLRAEDQMVVEADSVYLIPPKKNMTIFHGKLLLTDQKPRQGLNLPIDIFLNSLAEDQSMKSAAVILSGTGSDGMRGVKAIKEAGGLILVQSEDSAKFDGMPRSAISTGLADFVVPPEDMSDILQKCVANSGKIPTNLIDAEKIDQEHLTRIFSLLRGRTSVDFTYYKPSTILRRLDRRMSLNQIHELCDYVRFLETNPAEVGVLYKELLIGVTSFFRDSETFDFIEKEIIPKIFETAGDDGIRIWVSGCSTGEEAYSYAMMFSEYMEAHSINTEVKIFATDIDKDSILYAGNGVYPESSAAEMSQSRVLKFFHHRGNKLHIVRNIREMVVFAQHNLVKDPPFTNVNLVSCRNLLIYLQPVLQKKAMAMFQFALKTKGNGFLILGSSETTGDMGDCFEPLERKLRIYKKIGETRVSYENNFLSNFIRGSEKRKFDVRPSSRVHIANDERLLDRFLQSLPDNDLILAVFVNEGSEILYVAGNSNGILEIPGGRMSHDLNKVVCRGIAIPIATGLQKLLTTGEEVFYKKVKFQLNGVDTNININLRLVPQRKGQEKLVAILFKRTNLIEEVPQMDGKDSFDMSQESEQRISDLEQELQFTKENLQATIEELETSNEELQATNEELLSSNEELQSTNEELQSVNEELFTVNSEYQQKIIELTELNNDIDNLFSATNIGTIFLDENLEIRKFTSNVCDVLKILDHDVGRPFSQLCHHIGSVNLMAIIKKVEKTRRTESVEFQNTDGKWYLAKVLPYRISAKYVSGIVVSFLNIEEFKTIEKRLFREKELFGKVGQLAKIGGWELDLKTERTYWSDEIYSLYGISREQKPEEVAGQMSFYKPDAQKELAEAIEKTKVDGKLFDLTLPFKNAQGEDMWVRIRGRGYKRNGEISVIQGTFQDVSDIRRQVAQKDKEKILIDVIYELSSFEGKQKLEAEKYVGEKVSRLVGNACFDSCLVALVEKKSLNVVFAENREGRKLEVGSLNLKESLEDLSASISNSKEFSEIFEKPDFEKLSAFFKNSEPKLFPISIRGKFFGILVVTPGEEIESQVFCEEFLTKLARNIAFCFFLVGEELGADL